MNNLHLNINLSLNPLTIPVEELPTDFWNLIPKSIIASDLLNFLYGKKIKVDNISSFYEEHNSEVYEPGAIHSDCHGIGDMTKLIWMWGDDYNMSWYLPKPNTLVDYDYDINDLSPDNSIRNYTKFTLDQMDEIYSTKIGFPSLIQVGIPHQVKTFNGKRRSLTMALQDFNDNFISMNDAKIIFKDNIL